MNGATARVKVIQITDPYDKVYVNLRTAFGIVTAQTNLLDKVMALLQWNDERGSLTHEVVWACSSEVLDEYLFSYDDGCWRVLWRSDE